MTPPLTVEMLVAAYRRGWFPMADPLAGTIEWYSPDPRGIIPVDRPVVPRSLAREVRRGRFEIRADTAFEEVMRGCAAPRPTERLSWIDQRLVRAYVQMQQAGLAHSVEAWLDGRLVGGLYGVQVGGAFFGESMFHRPRHGGSNASKVCLVHLVRWLRRQGFELLDTQFWTEHLARFGCIEIARSRYLRLLRSAVDCPAAWGRFEPQPDAPMPLP